LGGAVWVLDDRFPHELGTGKSFDFSVLVFRADFWNVAGGVCDALAEVAADAATAGGRVVCEVRV